MAKDEKLLSWQAYDEVVGIRHAHITAKLAVQLIATHPGIGPNIISAIQVNRGFKELNAQTGSYQEAADRIIEIANEQIENDFQSYRRSSLVSLCAALEHLTKSVFVEWAEIGLDNLAGISSAKVSLSVTEFMATDERDRLFLVADKLYQDYPGTKGHFYKFQGFIHDFLPKQFSKFENDLKNISSKDFCEAFLVRNCVVHHGGRVNRLLGQLDGFETGKQIVFTQKMMDRYFIALEGMGSALFAAGVL